MNSILTTPREADSLLARLFAASKAARVRVSENRAFDNGWLDLGTLTLDPGGDKPSHVLTAIRRGAFEWALPSSNDARGALLPLLGLKAADQESPKLRRALDAMGGIATRLGLRFPRFDPFALEAMPYKRSTTVVADTSAVIQGGLDFVARHLHPAARVKVPAIVQMEIVNFAERFLSSRRAAKIRKLDLLIDHILSQAGQRVLLRLELNADTEIERNFLLGDPLRNAFQKDNDPDLQDLNLSVRIKAYADRLILESARQHQAQSNLGHKVQLLTSDQGLARMALAEGIVPAYFKSVVADDLFGRRLTGINLDPFTGKLRECPIAALLWELATAFGGVRLEAVDGADALEIAAFGEGLAWSPVQSHGDLLWCDSSGIAPKARREEIAPEAARQNVDDTPAVKSAAVREKLKPTPQRKKASRPVAAAPRPQRFNVAGFLALIDKLDNTQVLYESDVIKTVEAKNRNGVEDYKRFLLSGEFVAITADEWRITSAGSQLAIALRNEDVPRVVELLSRAPSFSEFRKTVQDTPIGRTIAPGQFERAFTTYRTLGEITLICATVQGEGVYPTPKLPTPQEFAPIAISRFRDLDVGEGLVSTGAWLEALVRSDGVHPEVARARLGDASGAGLLRRTTEGSTTDVRHDRHVLQVLRSRSGHPILEQVHLYRGDYLIPGKASTSLNIAEAAQ